MEVSKSVTCIIIILLIVFCGSVAGNRKALLSFKDLENNISDWMNEKPPSSSSSSSDNGICKSMVEKQGYVCEEHNVSKSHCNYTGWLHYQYGKNSDGSIGWDTGNQTTGFVTAWDLNGAWHDGQDGAIWLLLPPDRSLAFVLSDRGYDVWIPSSRGTKYSKGHKSLSPDDSAYWDWSWDELVTYELPAIYQYVYNETAQKLHFVGNSQGTLIALAAFSKGQLLNMSRSAALLSPIAYIGQITSPIGRSAADSFMGDAAYWLGLDEFDPVGEKVTAVMKDLCNKPGVDCTNTMTAFTGQNCCLNSSIIDMFLDHEPQAVSAKNMVHLAQMVRRGNITMYDYEDDEENMKHYGQMTPPAYNMSGIPNDLPLFISYGGADALSDANDVKKLLGCLRDHDEDKLVVQYRDNYGHGDFVMAENAKQYVYDPIMDFFRQHQ